MTIVVAYLRWAVAGTSYSHCYLGWASHMEEILHSDSPHHQVTGTICGRAMVVDER